MMLFLEPPCLTSIAALLTAPDEGIGLDVVEGPAQRRGVAVLARENGPIPLSATLSDGEDAKSGCYKDHSPHFELAVEKKCRNVSIARYRTLNGCLIFLSPASGDSQPRARAQANSACPADQVERLIGPGRLKKLLPT